MAGTESIHFSIWI